MIIEICCGSYEDGINAYKAGASRIELNSALYLGGLTPSLGTLHLLKQKIDIPIMCMVRNRGDGFCYNDEEFNVMLNDVGYLIKFGADGIVFGCLNEDHTINVEQTKEMVHLIKAYRKEVVFHRAFDLVEDPYKEIEFLISLGVDRILTSGLKKTAYEGKDLLKDLVSQYGDQIEILPGSGINKDNVKELISYTGVKSVHSSCKNYQRDITSTYKDVSFDYNKDGHEYVDYQIAKDFIDYVQKD